MIIKRGVFHLQVYRRRWVLHIERCSREKANGASVQVGVHPSKVSSQQLLTFPVDNDAVLGGDSEAKAGQRQAQDLGA